MFPIFIYVANKISALTCQINMQQVSLIIENMLIYTPLLNPARLLISEIFPSYFHSQLHNEEKVLFAHLIISEKILHDYIYTIWQFRVPTLM